METRELSKLKVNPQNPRGTVVHDAALRELAMSIQSVGVLEPIIITPNDLIVAGHRRVEAARLAKVETVPVIVKKLSQSEQLQVMLIENLQRADINILQEGAAYVKLVEYGLVPSLIAKTIGVSGSRLANCIAIQTLPEEIQRRFAWGTITISCATVLAALPQGQQEHWALIAASRKMTGTALQDAIQAPIVRRSVITQPKPILGSVKSIAPPIKNNNPYTLREMIRQLEILDEQLEKYSGFREIQSLLRQASSRMIEKMQGDNRSATAKSPPPGEAKAASLASVVSFTQRTAKKGI